MSTADILADHPEIDSWSIDEVQQRMRWVASRLTEAIREQRALVQAYGLAETDYKRLYHTTHLASSLDPGRADWSVAMHVSAAEIESAELNADRTVLKEQKSALRSEIDGLKTVLEVLRSHGKTARELSGGR